MPTRRCWKAWKGSCEGGLQAEPDGRLMRLLEESLSLNVQMTEPKAYLAESLPAGMEELMRLYVEAPPRERTPRLSGRAAIQSRMRAEFEHAGVWDLLRKRIAASEYTRPGDPLRIDMGYRPNGIVRMFHAVSLEPGIATGLDTAKVLAFSAAALRAGVERVEKAELELTAVIEPAARVGATDEEPETAGALPVRGGDDGGASDPRADDVGYGPRGGDGAARAARVTENREQG